VISQYIDGINYLLTHGDKPYSKAEFSKFVLDYGDQDLFNLCLEGHLHTRKERRTYVMERKIWNGVDTISMDEVNYRKMICPPLFTGNWYSESLGFSSSGGFILTQNNGSGKPIVYDYPL
jgi:hypothetical protein